MHLFRRWKRKDDRMPTDVPPAIADLIATIAEPSVPEGERLRKLVARARANNAGPEDLLAAQLAGIASVPAAYQKFDARLSRLFQSGSNLNYPTSALPYPEVILGGGFHGAGYACIRNLTEPGLQKALVLEAAEPGGSFAVTAQPSFWMNSEITGGTPGYPWDNAANELNWLPGAPVQAAQITAREFADNTVMRFVIRAALMLHARLITRANAVSVRPRNDGSMVVYLENGRSVLTKRVIDARGFGPEKDSAMADGVRVFTWTQAMRQMEQDYPFAGMRKVAVTGNGKSALCACEALLGIGPDGSMRTAAENSLQRVDLYGKILPVTRQTWLNLMQGRYLRLGSHLPISAEQDPDDGQFEPPGFGKFRDLYVYPEVGSVVKVPGGVLVNGRFYDCVIMANGHTAPPDLLEPTAFDLVSVGGRQVARKANGIQYYKIGVQADLPWQSPDYAAGVTAIADNRVAIHRLGPLTALLAASLPTP